VCRDEGGCRLEPLEEVVLEVDGPQVNSVPAQLWGATGVQQTRGDDLLDYNVALTDATCHRVCLRLQPCS
jgi:hypothetical protein